MVVNEVIETDELNKQAEKVQDPKEAVDVIKQYEDIIRTKKKGIINIAFYQGKVFKRFKEKDKFITQVNEFNIHKITIIFTYSNSDSDSDSSSVSMNLVIFVFFILC